MTDNKKNKHPFRLFPPQRVIKRITISDVSAVQNDEDVLAFITEQSKRLGKNGRLVLKLSGIATENYILTEGISKRACNRSIEEFERLLISKDYMKCEHEWEFIGETDYGEMDYSSYGAAVDHYVVKRYRCRICGVEYEESNGDPGTYDEE